MSGSGRGDQEKARAYNRAYAARWRANTSLEERRANYDAWYERHRDEYLAVRRARYAANREKEAARKSAWRKANREKETAYLREWHGRNVVIAGGERWVLSKTPPEIWEVLLLLKQARTTIRAQRRTS